MVLAAPRPALLAVRSRRQKPSPEQSHRARDRACRVLNVLVASVAVVLAVPVMFLVWALVRLTSKGPAVYKQERVGIDRRQRRNEDPEQCRRASDQGGKLFTLYKFRTMHVDQPAAQVWAAKDDPRITSIGRFLRATRLDELPQLFNVLKGDMNIVGPRPEQPKIFATLSEELGHYRQRQKVLPGITGLAQVTLPYDQNIDDVKKKVDLDLEYIRRRSAVKDLVIMAQTPAVMVLRKGAM
jgi:lipopolysaccharide/colanic/teichoic acid biosynthesis glycosyltransferase